MTISEAGDALHSPSYHIHPLDLRDLASGTASSQEQVGYLKEVDITIPTLLISECCLVYLSPSEADGVVDYFTRKLFSPTSVVNTDETETKTAPETTPTSTPLGLIIYEPIRPEDPFGRTMISNLAARGIHLQTVHKYASLETQRKRLRDHGFETGQSASDVDFLWERWVREEEKERVGGLEMLDEIEEWQLLARHYCVAWGWRGEGGLGNWAALPAQTGE